ncbi:MAG TPA: hypothetical protein VMG12_35025 [Polyangiaceae bacterium]|nr:hypothetical protein [Polyangiaceae bacterium]
MKTSRRTNAESRARARHALERVRGRRRQRGALFIEGLAVMLAIGFLLAVISWFHTVYRTKGDTLAGARLEAWTRARAGCRLVSADALLEQRGERGRVALGNGVFPDGMPLETRAIVTCNEPPAGDEPSLSAALDSLYSLVPWQPVDMRRWFFGASEPFAGMLGAMAFVGRSVSSAEREVSSAHAVLADRLGDMIGWADEAAAGALEWMTSLY